MRDSPSICIYLQPAVLLWGVGDFLILLAIDGFLLPREGSPFLSLVAERFTVTWT